VSTFRGALQNDSINLLDISYQELCEIVHGRITSNSSKLENYTIPKLTEEDIRKGKAIYKKVMRNMLVLLMMFHKNNIIRLDGFKKEAILYSLSPGLSKNLRTNLYI